MRRLLLRAAAGLGALLASLALVLFLAAGSPRFWQAWLYLAVFALCAALITVDLVVRDPALLARRVSAGPTAERERSQQVISAVAGALFLALHVVAGLDARFGWSAVPVAASLVAGLVMAAGFGVVLLTFRANSYTSATVQVAAGQALVDRGPYGIVRHPMYAGALLLVIATPVALGSWVALACVVPFALAIAARLLDEERYLRAHLRGYEAYRTRVPYRLVPFVW
ncbi:MAG TPA: isoprenylcysteine carboxylmethyltransferase family protein [Gemmatimonadaceae bacterium]|nr:isoprenylcysteine carboxylmethyltransferase family protein [Gemmatimonadaceae bacterium]